MNHERTELQIQSRQRNLNKGRRRKPRWTKAERTALGFPFNVPFPSFQSLDAAVLLRWSFAGGQSPDGMGKSEPDRVKLGWRLEHTAARRDLVRRLFGKKATITVKRLLQGLLPITGGWPARSRRVQEMIENFELLISAAGSNDYMFPEDRLFLLGIRHLGQGEVSKGLYAGIPFLQVLSNPSMKIDLQTADVVASFIVTFNDVCCSKSASGYINAKKGVEKRKARST